RRPPLHSSVSSPVVSASAPHAAAYTLSLHDALPICTKEFKQTYTLAKDKTKPTLEIVSPANGDYVAIGERADVVIRAFDKYGIRSEEHTSELQSRENLVCRLLLETNNQTTTRTPTVL